MMQMQAIVESARTGMVWIVDSDKSYPLRVRLTDNTIEFLHPNVGWMPAGLAMMDAIVMTAGCTRLTTEKVAELEGIVAERVAGRLPPISPYEPVPWGR